MLCAKHDLKVAYFFRRGGGGRGDAERGNEGGWGEGHRCRTGGQGEVTANLGDKYICLLHVLILRKSEKNRGIFLKVLSILIYMLRFTEPAHV